MSEIMTSVSAQKSPFHARAAAATADVMRPPLTTVGQYDHVAAAAYLMKHAGITALLVVDAQTGQPAGTITEADVARAIADGKDVNDVRVYAVMTTRPAVITTTSIRDAATIMAARHSHYFAAKCPGRGASRRLWQAVSVVRTSMLHLTGLTVPNGQDDTMTD